MSTAKEEVQSQGTVSQEEVEQRFPLTPQQLFRQSLPPLVSPVDGPESRIGVN